MSARDLTHFSLSIKYVSPWKDFQASITFLQQKKKKKIRQEQDKTRNPPSPNSMTQFQEVTSHSISTHWRPNKSDCERKQNSTRDVVEVQPPAEEVWILLAVRLVGGDYHSYSGSGCFPPLLYCWGVIKQSTERSSMTNPWRACKLKLWHLKRDSRSRGQWEEIEKKGVKSPEWENKKYWKWKWKWSPWL